MDLLRMLYRTIVVFHSYYWAREGDQMLCAEPAGCRLAEKTNLQELLHFSLLCVHSVDGTGTPR